MKNKIAAVLILCGLSVAIALAQASTNTTSHTSATVITRSFIFTAINFPVRPGLAPTG
jgi:hypothetical protein